MMQWRKTPKLLQNQKAIREVLLQHPAVQKAMQRYVNRLNLQGQINKGLLTENQAVQLFYDKGREFLDRLNDRIRQAMQKNATEINQTDLSNPLNMENALRNPNSLVNQVAADTAAEIEQSQDQFTEQNTIDSVNNSTILPTADIPSTDTTVASDSSLFSHPIEEGALLTATFMAIDKEALADVAAGFEKLTGIKNIHLPEMNIVKEAEGELKDLSLKLKPSENFMKKVEDEKK